MKLQAGKCACSRCDEKVEGSRVFCELHWNYLTAHDRARLARDYGTPHWEASVEEAARKTNQLEAAVDARTRWR